jgi:hypothetical protein
MELKAASFNAVQAHLGLLGAIFVSLGAGYVPILS